MDEKRREESIKEILRMVELKKEIDERMNEKVSGGKLKRICIESEMDVNKKMIIIDEEV